MTQLYTYIQNTYIILSYTIPRTIRINILCEMFRVMTDEYIIILWVKHNITKNCRLGVLLRAVLLYLYIIIMPR